MEEVKTEEEEFDEVVCNYLECLAGMGVAGSLRCFLGGDYRDKNCGKFVDEERWLKEYEEAHEAENRFRCGERKL